MRKFLTTPLGSFVKVFVPVLITGYIAKYNSGTPCVTVECWKELAFAAFISALPVLNNWLNPEYKGYGKTNDNGNQEQVPS